MKVTNMSPLGAQNRWRVSTLGPALASLAASLLSQAPSPTPDTFNPGANSPVTCSTFQADGKILLGGSFTIRWPVNRVGILVVLMPMALLTTPSIRGRVTRCDPWSYWRTGGSSSPAFSPRLGGLIALTSGDSLGKG